MNCFPFDKDPFHFGNCAKLYERKCWQPKNTTHPFELEQYIFLTGIWNFKSMIALQTPSLYRLQGSPCVVILTCKDPVKITGYHSNPSSSVVGT